MLTGRHADVLAPGLATGIGSLPHTDARAAAELSCSANPSLPCVPQLPVRDPREGLIAQWAGALPEVTVARDGSISIEVDRATDPVVPAFDAASHEGLYAFLDVVATQPPARVKLQVVGPLTLGVALLDAGMPRELAFRRAGAAVKAWMRALDALMAEALPGTPTVTFLDEPALVLWRRDEAPIEREEAVDLLSASLAASRSVTGVHVCGDGDLRLAFEAGTEVLGVPVSEALIDDADGWIAWGAIPTDRPVGDSGDALWRKLAAVWCELTRRGCDPVQLRTRGIITPACGLAGHGISQADRALRLAADLAGRMGDQAVAARLTVGA
jgi:hypothetical protein